MRYRERILYILMVVGSISWLLFMLMGWVFSIQSESEWGWTKSIDALFFLIAMLAFSATLIFSIFIMVVGPKKVRFAVLKWILVFFPSVMSFSHHIPPWVPIVFSIALVALSTRWLVIERNNKVKGNVSA